MADLFRRTLSGIRNFGRFVRRPIVAYCEGGPHIELSDAIAGIYNISAEDVTFWQIVCRSCLGPDRVHVKAIGGSKNVHAMAAVIIQGNVPGACVVSDRDFRNFDGTRVNDPRVIYTPGYSWENTVAKPRVIAGAAVAIGNLPVSSIADAVVFASEWIQRLVSVLKWPLYLEISALGAGMVYVEKNNRCGGVFVLDGGGQIVFVRERLYQKIRQYSGQHVRNIAVRADQIRDTAHVPGHGLMGFSALIITSYLRLQGVSKPVNDQLVHTVLLQEFDKLFTSADYGAEWNYYRAALIAVPH